MGQSGPSKKIRVASINYGGLLHSPFEFFDKDIIAEPDQTDHVQQTPLQKLNQLFQNIACKQIMMLMNRGDDKNTQFGYFYDNGQFAWKINQFDKNMHRQRYCPLYRKHVGVTASRFLNKQQFDEIWDRQFEKNKGYIKWKADEIEKTMINRCRLYDFLIYKTFMEYCYKIACQKYNIFIQQNDIQDQKQWQYTKGTLEDRIQFFSHDNTQTKRKLRFALKQYNDFIDEFFDKPYLSQKRKYNQILKIVDKHDVVFLQDTTDFLINQLKNNNGINIILPPCGKQTAIVVRQNNFKTLFNPTKIFEIPQQKISLTQESFNYSLKQKQRTAHLIINSFSAIGVDPLASSIKDKLPQVKKQSTFNSNGKIQSVGSLQSMSLNSKSKKPKNNTTVCLVDNFLFINIYFSSRPSMNNLQLQNLLAHKQQLLADFPYLNIVFGGDWNNANIPSEINRDLDQTAIFLQCFPKDDRINTTIKKRTHLQSQRDKSNMIDEKCRDFIVTNMKMISGSIDFEGKLKDKEYLPNQKHLFDHAVVSVVLKTKQ